jgi:hypothetical protein
LQIQFQTDSLSRCPSHAHSKCVPGLPVPWKNGSSFYKPAVRRLLLEYHKMGSLCVLVYWTIRLLIAIRCCVLLPPFSVAWKVGAGALLLLKTCLGLTPTAHRSNSPYL